MLESGSGFDEEASGVCLWRGVAARRGRGAKVVARCASRTSKKLVAGLRRRVGGAICAAAAAWRCVVSLQGWLRDRCGQLWSAPAKVAVCAASEQVCRPLNEVSVWPPGTLQWHLVVASMSSIIPSVTNNTRKHHSRLRRTLHASRAPKESCNLKKPRSSQSIKLSKQFARAAGASISPAARQRHRPQASSTHPFRTLGSPQSNGAHHR